MQNYEWVYFLTIAEEGSLTKAAQKLFISQPALSQYLSKLEKSMETKLYERQKNNALTLTPAGIRYRRYCQEALQLWENACSDMKVQEKKAAITLGMSSPRMMKIMEEYFRSRPDCSHFMVQRLRAAELPEKLLSGEIQVAMGAYVSEHPMLRYRCLFCRELDLLVPYDHPLASRSFLVSGNENVRIKLEEVGDMPFSMLNKDMLWRKLIEKHCKKLNVQLNVECESAASSEMWQKATEKHLATFQIHDFDTTLTPPGMMPVALDPPIYYVSGVFHRKDLEITPQMQQIIERYCAYSFE